MRLKIILFSLLSLCVACHRPEEGKPRVIVNNSLAPDFKIPQQIFTEIKKSLGVDLKIEPEYLFTDVEVDLYSDQKAVLLYPFLQFNLPNGGGALDLKDYVVGDGSFYLSFPEEQFANKPPLEFLFYLSNSPKKKIKDEKYGLGCGQWVDLRPKLRDLQTRTFLKVNSIDHSYAHVLSGQYIFVFKKGIQYYLAHVNVSDSRYNDEMCSNIFTVK